MIKTKKNRIQFIAQFKLEKKLIQSNIAFILLSRDKRIINISSGCIRMLGLDLYKLKKYT
jgi:hypothetical protein